MQTNDPMIAANTVARELNQPEGGKGARRLAEDLAAQHPAEQPIRLLLLELAARTGGHAPEVRCELCRDGQIRWQVSVLAGGGCALKSADTLRDAYAACLEDAKAVARKARVMHIAEKLAADELAAEASMSTHATAPQVPEEPLVKLGPGGDFVREVKP